MSSASILIPASAKAARCTARRPAPTAAGVRRIFAFPVPRICPDIARRADDADPPLAVRALVRCRASACRAPARARGQQCLRRRRDHVTPARLFRPAAGRGAARRQGAGRRQAGCAHGSAATLRLPAAEAGRNVVAQFGEERIVARAWPASENRIAIAELTYWPLAGALYLRERAMNIASVRLADHPSDPAACARRHVVSLGRVAVLKQNMIATWGQRADGRRGHQGPLFPPQQLHSQFSRMQFGMSCSAIMITTRARRRPFPSADIAFLFPSRWPKTPRPRRPRNGMRLRRLEPGGGCRALGRRLLSS